MSRLRSQKQTGFTLIELMLAMAFVAVLLLAIAAVVLQVAGIYNKGTTMKAVNQASRSIVTDMRRTIGESKPFSAAANFILLPVDTSATPAAPEGGRLCTGLYTYVWNIGDKHRNTYEGDSSRQLRFIRVSDNGGQYCIDPNRNIKTTDNPTELFAADTGMAVQCLQINQMSCSAGTRPTVQDITVPLAGTQLYGISMIISNADQDAIDGVGRCKAPSEDASVQNYCAINEIDFTVSAGNGGGQ